LDVRTQQKVEILSSGPEMTARLLQFIDKESLPMQYGGTAPNPFTSSVNTEYVTIPRSGTIKKLVNLPKTKKLLVESYVTDGPISLEVYSVNKAMCDEIFLSSLSHIHHKSASDSSVVGSLSSCESISTSEWSRFLQKHNDSSSAAVVSSVFSRAASRAPSSTTFSSSNSSSRSSASDESLDDSPSNSEKHKKDHQRLQLIFKKELKNSHENPSSNPQRFSCEIPLSSSPEDDGREEDATCVVVWSNPAMFYTKPLIFNIVLQENASSSGSSSLSSLSTALAAAEFGSSFSHENADNSSSSPVTHCYFDLRSSASTPEKSNNAILS
jgi:hypothetical protein